MILRSRLYCSIILNITYLTTEEIEFVESGMLKVATKNVLIDPSNERKIVDFREMGFNDVLALGRHSYARGHRRQVRSLPGRPGSRRGRETSGQLLLRILLIKRT